MSTRFSSLPDYVTIPCGIAVVNSHGCIGIVADSTSFDDGRIVYAVRYSDDVVDTEFDDTIVVLDNITLARSLEFSDAPFL